MLVKHLYRNLVVATNSKVVKIETKYQLIPLVYLPVNHLFWEQITQITTESKGKNKANTLGKASIEESLGMPAGEHILKFHFMKELPMVCTEITATNGPLKWQ